MSGQITFTMIKPLAVEKGHTGAILKKISDGGFQIIAMKMTQLSKEQAMKFYKIHEDKPFYNNLCTFMSSGPIVAAILKKEDAVEAYRNYIGATDPEKAPEGSIRSMFGTSLQQNAVHGSDSDDNAHIEASFFFSDLERFFI